MTGRWGTPLYFMLLTLVVTYSLWFASMALARFGGVWLGGLPVLGPAIAAFFMVRHVGAGRWLAGELSEARVRWWWLLVPPVFFATAYLIAAALGVSVPLDWQSAFLLLAVQTILTGLPEEIGWRAYLTRSMLRTHSPLVTSLFVGVGWGLWHGPKLMMIPLLPVTAVAMSVLMTYAFARLRGGLPLAMLIHGSFNGALFWAERGDPNMAVAMHDVFAGVLSVAAIALVAWKRDWYLAKPGRA